MLRLLAPGARARRGLMTSCSRGAARAIACAGVLSLLAAPSALANVSASSPGNIGVSISTPGPVLSGIASTYTVTATNNTQTDFSFTSVGGQLATNMTLNGFGVADDCARSNSNAFGILRGPGFSCIWAVPVAGAPATVLTLAPEATASWTFNATAPSVGTYGIHVTAQGTFASPTALGNGVSNAVDLSVPVSPGPTDIQVNGSSNNGSPPVGSQFKYTFQVKDNGPQAAYGVTFDDALPPSLTMVGFSSDIAACSAGSTANSVHCGVEVLGVGQQATITIIAVANTTGSITDTASIGMLGPDLKPANNTVGVTVQPK